MTLTRQTKRRYQKAVTFIALGFFLIISLFPFYWMVSTSFKNSQEIYQIVQSLYPKKFVLDHYRYAVSNSMFPIYMRNSILVALVTTAISIFVSAFAAYSIVRIRFRGKAVVSRGIIFSYLIPPALLFIPLFRVVTMLGLYDSLLSLIVTYLTFATPFSTWMLIGYFRTVPKEIEEAAMIDGCSRVGALFRILFPLSLPGISAVSLFVFTRCWNEFLYAMVFITDERNKTIPIGLQGLLLDDMYLWGELMAMSVLASIPPILIYIFGQKWVVGGFVAGGVKA
jgi:ABC-type glycerol-3-phosphate transport system permease component